MKALIALAVAGILLAAVVIAVYPVHAYTRDRPYYTSGDTTLKGKLKIDSNCWDLAYLRGTPKGANHVLLNYQYFHNAHPTSEIKTVTLDYSLKFKIIRILQSPDERARVYAEVELTKRDFETVVTVYFDIDQSMKGQTIIVPTLHAHTNPVLCQ